MRRQTRGVVLVTGASSGIGRLCAIRLARAGFFVFGTTRQSPSEVQSRLRAEAEGTDRLVMLGVDVTRNETVVAAVESIVGRTGRLDAVVSSAGYGLAGAVEDTSDEEALAILDTNLLGAHRVCRAALPIMRTQQSGVLVLISSLAGRLGLPYQAFYSASKFALEGLAEALRLEVRRYGVRVVLVEPGDFSTEFTDNRQYTGVTTIDSIYRDSFQRTMAIVESDERTAASPAAVADRVIRILGTKHPRLRYTVGPMKQRLAALVKRVVPDSWFEAILRAAYRMERHQ